MSPRVHSVIKLSLWESNGYHVSPPCKTKCVLGSCTLTSINNCGLHGRGYEVITSNISIIPCRNAWHEMCPQTVTQRMVMDQCECLCDLHVFSQWPSGTWRCSSRAGFRTERPSIWSTTPPGGRKVKYSTLLLYFSRIEPTKCYSMCHQNVLKSQLSGMFVILLRFCFGAASLTYKALAGTDKETRLERQKDVSQGKRPYGLGNYKSLLVHALVDNWRLSVQNEQLVPYIQHWTI